MTSHTRILRPAEGILAFYDGRVEGYRFAPAPNWVDEGAISLGIASYAVVDGDEALVYDTHVSVEHGRLIRDDAGSARECGASPSCSATGTSTTSPAPPPSPTAR